MLTPRENLLRVFRHEAPEWIPVVGHVDPFNRPALDGMDPETAEAIGEIEMFGEATIRFSRRLGLDVMDFARQPLATRHERVTITTEWRGDALHKRWETPVGVLTETQRRLGGADGGPASMAPVEYPLKSEADFKTLACVMEDETFAIDADRARTLEARRRLIGDDGLLGVAVVGTPFGNLARMYMDLESLCVTVCENPEAVAELLAAIEDNYLRQIRLVAPLDIDAVYSIDDTSTTTTSPPLFREFSAPYVDKAADVFHAAGVIYCHHSCGLIRDLVGLYRDTKMDAVHMLQTPPLGNVSIREAKEKLGDRIVIIASLNQLSGSTADWDALAGSIGEMFEGAAPGDNFILNLAPYPHNDMRTIERVREECRRRQSIC